MLGEQSRSQGWNKNDYLQRRSFSGPDQDASLVFCSIFSCAEINVPELEGETPPTVWPQKKKLTHSAAVTQGQILASITDAKGKALGFVVCFSCRSADLKPLISCYLLLDWKRTQARSETTRSNRQRSPWKLQTSKMSVNFLTSYLVSKVAAL